MPFNYIKGFFISPNITFLNCAGANDIRLYIEHPLLTQVAYF